jgi:P27 family predicted phage terminase small subunit
VKKLRGTYRKDRAPKKEPAPPSKIPECPAHLGIHARAEWNRIAPQLLELGLLSDGDRAHLAAYCEAWDRWVKACLILEKNGYTFTTPNGYLQQRPEVSIAAKAKEELKHFGDRFGLNPAARSRMETDAPPATPDAPNPPRDEVEEFLFSKHSRGA